MSRNIWSGSPAGLPVNIALMPQLMQVGQGMRHPSAGQEVGGLKPPGGCQATGRPTGPSNANPLAIWNEVHVGLHRDPISAGCKHSRCGQGHLENAGIVDIRLGCRAVNLCPGQAAVISVEKDVEIVGRAPATAIKTLRVHFGNIPRLTTGTTKSSAVKSVWSGTSGTLRRRAD